MGNDTSTARPSANLVDVLDTGEYSDLLVECNGHSFNVHRVIVCPQSKFFEKACSSEFKEKREGAIELNEVDLDAVKAMFRYFYKRDYQDAIPKQSGGITVAPLTFHFSVYQLSVQYQAPDLRKHALQRFREQIDQRWAGKEFANAITGIYDDVPEEEQRDILDAVIEVAAANIVSLVRINGPFMEVVGSQPGFARELFRKVFKTTHSIKADPVQDPGICYSCKKINN